MFVKAAIAGALAMALPAQYAMPDYVPVPPQGRSICDERGQVCITRFPDFMAMRLQLELADNLIRQQGQLIEALKAEVDKNTKKCAVLTPERRT